MLSNFLPDHIAYPVLNFLSDNKREVLLCAAGALALWLTFRKPSGLPPGPALSWPIIGHVLSVGKDPRKKFKKWHEKYGDIFSIYLGNRLVIVIGGYETMKEAFVKNGDVFSDRPHIFVLDEIGRGKGVLSTSGDVWKEQRRFTLSTLRDLGLGKNVLEHKINEEALAFLEVIDKMKGKKFAFRDIIHTAVANIICSVVFGKRYDYGDELFEELTKKIDENVQSAGTTAGLNFFPFARYVPGDPFKFKRTMSNVNFVLKKVIGPLTKSHLDSFDDNNIHDFVSAYIQAVKLKESNGEQTSIGLDNMEMVIADLLNAGTETTATTIRWIILYLMKYPEVQEKCHQEIKENIGLERQPHMSDKLKLPFMEATISEVQRVANIVPVSIWHSVPHDVQFKGYTFPKGVVVVPNIESVLKDPETFKDPDEFHPERFIDASGKYVKAEQLIPFFFGKRVCIGEGLARMELFLFVTAMLQRFKFQKPDDEQELSMEAVPGITFGPRPFNVVAIPR